MTIPQATIRTGRRRRHPFLSVGVIALAAILALLLGNRTGLASDRYLSGHPRPVRGVQQQPVDEEAARQALADKFAPITFLKDQDEPCDKKGEPYEPSPVEIVLGNPDVILKRTTTGTTVDVTAGPLPADLYGKDDTYYLDFPGDPARPKCGYEQAFREIEPRFPPVTYAHIATEEGYRGIALQFWFYYYFNDWNNNHESDWEMIQLTFDAPSATEALQQQPSGVLYAQHGGGETSSWDSSKLQREGDHVYVYPGAGSHGSYYSQATYFGKGADGTGFGCDNTTSPSRRVELEARLIPGVVDAASPYAWTTYQGRWGELRHGELNGPTGPNVKTQWTQPFSWQEKQRDSSVTVPLKIQVGPNAVLLFCNAAAFGSNLFFATGPWVLLGIVVLGIATIGATARRTDFRPALRMPLRKTRRFGQVLTSSFAVYRSQPMLFLAIGSVFIPLGFLNAGIQALLHGWAALEPLFELLEGTVLGSALALGFGLLQFGIVYWLVLAAVTAALGEMTEGRGVSVRKAYALAFRRIGPLLRARLRSVAILAMLSVTLVGIPIAIYLGVRWTFLEPAILIDGAGARESRRISDEVVHARWWRTLGCAYPIMFGGIALGPVIGALMVLLSSVALGYINVISSIVYLVLVPYVGIALTLLYFDLQERRARAA